MNISTVNELIQSLESAGELSIKEREYLELAKAYQQLVAENVALKAAIDATIGWQQSTDVENVESVKMLFDINTPATDRIVAGIKADGVEEFVSNTVHKIFDESEAVSALAYLSLANSHVKQLREGADK